MSINNAFLKDEMKIGVIGISGKGKTTLLNHLIDEKVAAELAPLIGPKYKEYVNSGRTKNPVRYFINKQANTNDFKCIVSKYNIENKTIDAESATEYAQSNEKCTITIIAPPSNEFRKVMDNYDLNKLEFIDTQGLLDNINEETAVPLEIKECAVLLYLYDDTDQGVRGDYIEKYKKFLNEISDKPLIFLETGIQWQVEEIEDIDKAEEKLSKKDKNYSKSADEIRNRYVALTGNKEYEKAFLLTSVLSESESSVNFYEVKITNALNQYFDLCLRKCAAHALNTVFQRLANIIDKLNEEFKKAKGIYQHDVGFKGCYGLLSDIFVVGYQRIDYYSYARVLRAARRDIDRFKKALEAFNTGKLFNARFDKVQKEVHTEYGYHCIYETYENQAVLDCMQLFLDLYKYYLSHISVSGSKLSKAIQVYLTRSISNDYMCRDTSYKIEILDENTFITCLQELKAWVGDLTVQKVRYKYYDEFDIDYPNKNEIIKRCKNSIQEVPSLISKMDYFCSCINNMMYSLAFEKIANSL